MARKIWDFKKLCDEVDSAHAAIDPLLNKAAVLTIPVDGKPVAASEAPLPAKISALHAATPTAEESEQGVKQLYVTNSTLAAQLEKQVVELATANATVGTLQAETRTLTSRAESAEAAVQTLTAEKGQLNVQLKAAHSEFERATREQDAFNTELSKACIAVGCLQLTDANGAALKQTATEEQKLEAANKISVSEKLKAYQGGLNTAIAATGLNVASLPNSAGSRGQTQSETLTNAAVLLQLEAIKDPMERARFHKANASKIFAAMKATQKQ